VEVRRRLIAQVGYERICNAVHAIVIDTWREYTLLIIDRVEKFYSRRQELVKIEPIVLLKMTCPSVNRIYSYPPSAARDGKCRGGDYLGKSWHSSRWLWRQPAVRYSLSK